MRPLPSFLFIALFTAAPFLAGCDSGGGGAEGPTFDGDVSALLENEANDVILATYQDLEAQATNLEAAVDQLADDPTTAHLEAARAAWRAARAPWESTESFLFGPVDDNKSDPALDSWPTDEAGIQAVLGSDRALTVDFIDGLDPDADGGRKGFHTVELFLFGADGEKTVSDFTPRAFEYLRAATGSLQNTTEALAAAWAGPDGYAQEFITAGEEGSLYISQKAAVEQLVTSMFEIANEVGTGKIGTPLDEGTILRIESKYSLNSLQDFQNNLSSIRSIYTGDYAGHSGPGVDAIVRALDPDLDARLTSEIDAAIEALVQVEQGPGSFRAAIEGGDTAGMEVARAAVLTIRETLNDDVQPLISGVQL